VTSSFVHILFVYTVPVKSVCCFRLYTHLGNLSFPDFCSDREATNVIIGHINRFCYLLTYLYGNRDHSGSMQCNADSYCVCRSNEPRPIRLRPDRTDYSRPLSKRLRTPCDLQATVGIDEIPCKPL